MPTLFFNTGKKIRTYTKLVKEAANEDTRPGALMKLGIRVMLEVAGKAIGTSLTSHPYFTYHKAHLEALGQALNASSNFDSAQSALNRAIRSADASASLTETLGDYTCRKNVLKLIYATLIGGSVEAVGRFRDASREAAQRGGRDPRLLAPADRPEYL